MILILIGLLVFVTIVWSTLRFSNPPVDKKTTDINPDRRKTRKGHLIR